MDKKLEQIVKALQERYKAAWEEFRGEAHVFVDTGQVVEALAWLRDQQTFELLSAMTAVDYHPQEEPRFHVIYQLTSIEQNLSLMLRVPISGSQPEIPTATGIYGNANWREREIFDMFGIRFVGHPDPRRILMPQDWEGHPLRKDYPLGYEEPQFSFNIEEIDLQKPYARE